jgi:hypothetical protein
MILEQTADVRVPKAIRIIGIWSEDLKAIAIEAIEAILSPESHEPLPILEHGVDYRLGKALFGREDVEAHQGLAAWQLLAGLDGGLRNADRFWRAGGSSQRHTP